MVGVVDELMFFVEGFDVDVSFVGLFCEVVFEDMVVSGDFGVVWVEIIGIMIVWYEKMSVVFEVL